jgi:hypothetical protein
MATGEKFNYAQHLIKKQGLTLDQANRKVAARYGAGLDAVALNTLKSVKPGGKPGVRKRKRAFARAKLRQGWSNQQIKEEARLKFGTEISNYLLARLREEITEEMTPKAKGKTHSDDTCPNGMSKAMYVLVESLHHLMNADGVETLEIDARGNVELSIRKVEVTTVTARV